MRKRRLYHLCSYISNRKCGLPRGLSRNRRQELSNITQHRIEKGYRACRRALLERCIKDDFLGEQNEKDQLQKRWRREGVRTGRLMNTITALLTAYAEDGKEVDSPEVQRALDIKKAALALLEELKD